MTRIKYILVCDKLYEVERISFFDFSVSAKETDKTIDDVPSQLAWKSGGFQKICGKSEGEVLKVA